MPWGCELVKKSIMLFQVINNMILSFTSEIRVIKFEFVCKRERNRLCSDFRYFGSALEDKLVLILCLKC